MNYKTQHDEKYRGKAENVHQKNNKWYLHCTKIVVIYMDYKYQTAMELLGTTNASYRIIVTDKLKFEI